MEYKIQFKSGKTSLFTACLYNIYGGFITFSDEDNTQILSISSDSVDSVSTLGSVLKDPVEDDIENWPNGEHLKITGLIMTAPELLVQGIKSCCDVRLDAIKAGGC